MATVNWGLTAPRFTETDQEQETEGLSQEELELARRDCHGQPVSSNPSAERMAECITAMNRALEEIPEEKKQACVAAMAQCPAQCNDEEKRNFLWRVEFDPEKAAKRMVKYWEWRRELFGEDRCFAPMNRGGTLRSENKALQYSLLYVLPATDKTGRPIILMDPSQIKMHLYSEEQMIQAQWFVLESILRRQEVKRDCVVVILFRNVTILNFYRRIIKFVLELEQDYLPVRIRSVHICHPSNSYDLYGPILMCLLGRHLRTRTAVHEGSDREVLDALEEYGIPRETMPTSMGGKTMIDHRGYPEELN